MSIDRRSEYSRHAIKDAFLELLGEKRYSDISITDIARRSNVSRGTLYAQYARKVNLLNEVLSDAFSMISATVALERNEQDKIPLCQMIRTRSKYQGMFLNEDLTDYIAEQMITYFRPAFIACVSEEGGMSGNAAAAFLELQVHGCYAVARKNVEHSDEEWNEIRRNIDAWIYNGSLKRH